MSTTELKSPGRLGDPTMTLVTDPRTNPRLLSQLQAAGMSGNLEVDIPPIDAPESTLEAMIAPMGLGAQALYDTLPNDLPSDGDEPVVARETLAIHGDGGDPIALHLFHPPAPTGTRAGAVPAIVYYHGGGMTIQKTVNRVHVRWCTSLALKGALVVMVDFRNSWAEGGGHAPFPAGLEDCAAAARYVHRRRGELGIGKVVLQGESGGANLSLAVALKAKREGWVREIDGVYAQVPYISGAYDWGRERKERELPSLVECDGYLMSAGGLAAMVTWYAPDDRENPLAWPYFATAEDMEGLPPHYIAVAELDMLKSEGLAYHRKLLAAGVESTACVSVGVVHGAYLIFRKALPVEHDWEARKVVAFANSL